MRMSPVFVVGEPADRTFVTQLLDKATWEVREFDSPDEFLRSQPPTEAGCVVAWETLDGDLSLPVVLQRLRAERRSNPLVLATRSPEASAVARAMREGVVDVLLAPLQPDLLQAALERALTRERRDRSWREKQESALAELATLTAEEREVMQLVLEGHMNKTIAHRVGKSLRTVEGRRACVMRKMHCETLADLLRKAVFSGQLKLAEDVEPQEAPA